MFGLLAVKMLPCLECYSLGEKQIVSPTFYVETPKKRKKLSNLKIIKASAGNSHY